MRTILLSLPDSDDMMRGIISTLSNPKGSVYIPVAAPIVLRKLRKEEEPTLASSRKIIAAMANTGRGWRRC